MHLRHPLLVAISVLTAAPATAGDWMFAPSYFTHDPVDGQRVDQYSPTPAVYIYPYGDFVQSGYRQIRSSLRGRHSADNIHVTEEWGRPVRPYGEWQRPYRPYSVPYDLWGEPYAGLDYHYGPRFYGERRRGPSHGRSDPRTRGPDRRPGSGRPYDERDHRP